jgi:hypothetical protein
MATTTLNLTNSANQEKPSFRQWLRSCTIRQIMYSLVERKCSWAEKDYCIFWMKASRCAWKSISLHKKNVGTIYLFYSKATCFDWRLVILRPLQFCYRMFCPLWDPVLFTTMEHVYPIRKAGIPQHQPQYVNSISEECTLCTLTHWTGSSWFNVLMFKHSL